MKAQLLDVLARVVLGGAREVWVLNRLEDAAREPPTKYGERSLLRYGLADVFRRLGRRCGAADDDSRLRTRHPIASGNSANWKRGGNNW